MSAGVFYSAEDLLAYFEGRIELPGADALASSPEGLWPKFSADGRTMVMEYETAWRPPGWTPVYSGFLNDLRYIVFEDRRPHGDSLSVSHP